MIKKTLFTFTPFKVKAIKTLPLSVEWCFSSHYSKGTLYTERCMVTEKFAFRIEQGFSEGLLFS
jgi:hypothetical protein